MGYHPLDTELMTYVEGGCDPSLRPQIYSHAMGCRKCRMNVIRMVTSVDDVHPDLVDLRAFLLGND